MIRHREDYDIHRRRENRTGASVARRIPVDLFSLAQRFLEDLRAFALIPEAPGFSADHVMRGGGVVVAVAVELVVVAVLEKKLGAFEHERIVVLPADLQ